jgi:hypothetical protein
MATRQAQAVTGEEMNQIREPASTPEQSLIQREKIELMQIIMRELRPRDVEVLNRFYFLDQMEEQIRSEMNLTATQFRLLKSRAKGRFTQLIQQRLRLKARIQ